MFGIGFESRLCAPMKVTATAAKVRKSTSGSAPMP